MAGETKDHSNYPYAVTDMEKREREMTSVVCVFLSNQCVKKTTTESKVFLYLFDLEKKKSSYNYSQSPQIDSRQTQFHFQMYVCVRVRFFVRSD